MAIVAYVACLVVIAILHVAIFRLSLRSERSIFVFHLVLFLALPITAWHLIGAQTEQQPFVTLAAMYGLHACFSLIFLEIWSLSQGGYSLQILDLVDRSAAMDVHTAAERIGDAKLELRFDSLARLGLIAVSDEGHIRSTRRGRYVATVGHLLADVAGTTLRE